MAKAIVLTGYMYGGEISKLSNWNEERDAVINKVMTGLENHSLRSDLEDDIHDLRILNVIDETDQIMFLELVPKIEDDYINEFIDIKVIDYKVLETFEPLN